MISTGLTYLLTYSPSPQSGYGPPITDLHSPLSCAILSNSFQLYPIFLMSTSKSLRHVLLGRPFFLLPCGFLFSACLVMQVGDLRKVCPIHPHLLFFISSSIGLWEVLCQRLVLLLVSADLDNSPKATVNKCLYLAQCVFCCSPSLCTI